MIWLSRGLSLVTNKQKKNKPQCIQIKNHPRPMAMQLKNPASVKVKDMSWDLQIRRPVAILRLIQWSQCIKSLSIQARWPIRRELISFSVA